MVVRVNSVAPTVPALAMIVACGLELRIPFLDHMLVEIVLRMPQRFHFLGKGLLRQSFAGLFSSGSLNRPKQGFVLLMASWISQQLQGFWDRAWSLLALGEIAQREQMP